MKYMYEPLEKAAKHCVEELRHDGGVGGVIALDNQGNCKYLTFGMKFTDSYICSPVALPLNCSGMYRGVVGPDGVPKTAIFDDDELD